MPKPPQDNAFELEGMVSTLTVLRIQRDDLAAIEASLRAKVKAMPGFFHGAPVAFDLSDVDGSEEADPPGRPCALSLAALVRLARETGLVPVGIRNPHTARTEEASQAGLGMLRGGPRARRDEAPSPEPAIENEADEAAERRAPGDRRREAGPALPSYVTLRQPLRGGQVVYAEQADAVALAPINHGAELIADGNIHVYGALRGRALAGAHGDESARIFCQSLEADLVSIAGTYLRAEELPEAQRGKPVQISLEDGQLVIRPLGS